MRLLHVLGEIGFSGGENQLGATLRHLAARGHEQQIVLDPRARFRPVATELGVPIIECTFRGNFDPIATMRLRRILRSTSADLIHFACSRSHKVGALARAFVRGLPPIVLTRRMDYPIRDSGYRRWLWRKAVDRVIVISHGVRDAVLGIGVDPGRIDLVHEGVDTGLLGRLREPERRRAARHRLQLGSGDFFGVTTASLHVRKAHDVLLDALRRVGVPSGRRVVWLFGGAGPERERLAALAATLPESIEVRIPGQIDYVHDALSAADAYCLPSRYEGLGVALLEAMATGVPCIASEVGGMRDVLVSGESGLHVPPEDAGALAEAIHLLLGDAALGARLGAAGRQRAREMFDVERMGRGVEAVFAKTIGDRARVASA